MLVIGVGTIIRHRKYNCRVLRFLNKGVVVKRVNTGLVLTIPYGQMPTYSVG